MELEDHIEEIQQRLRSGEYTNESSVVHGIVIRLIEALGWPKWDPQCVCPEFPVQNGRVDLALCPKARRPLIFLEVKKVGKIEGADQQLFEYAFRHGVPLAIVSDGQEWHFYLPGEEGSISDRKVYTLDLLQRKTGESAKRLRRYLSFERCSAGPAIEDARSDLRDVARKRRIRSTLPEAW